jgi:phosphoribosylformylglycinamidine cyclo-ligase
VFELIATRGHVSEEELHEVFNLGCGFCCVVPPAQAEAASALLSERHPGAAVIGVASDRAGVVEVSPPGLLGSRGHGFTAVR